MFKLASLFVDIKADQSGFDKSLGGVHKQLSTASVAVGTFVGNVATMFSRIALSAAGGLFEGTIKSASNLNESISKTKAIYGDAAGSIIANADQMAKTFGLSKQEMLDASGIFGLMAKGAGSSGEASAAFGNKMTKLAADAMSFYNVPMDVALEKIRSGLSGESEPLRAFGVFLSEAAVQTEALRMGLSKNANELTDGQKIMARASLISKGLGDASGDLERTFSGTENQTRKFWGTLSNLGQDIGSVLLPAFDQLLAIATSTLTNISAGWENNKGTFRGWVDTIREGIDILGIAWQNWDGMVEIAQLTASQYLTAFIDTVSSWAGTIGKFLIIPADFLVTSFLGAVGVVAGAFDKLISGIASAWNSAVKTMATGLDFLLRPLNDLGRFIGHQNDKRTIEERVNAMQVGTGGTNVAGVIEDQKKTFEAMSARQKASLDALGKPTDTTTISDRIAEITNQMAERAAAAIKPKAAEMDVAKKAQAAQEDAAKKQHKPEITGVAEFAAKLRLAQGGGDVPQKQLTELQLLRKQEAESTKALVDAFRGGNMAVLG